MNCTQMEFKELTEEKLREGGGGLIFNKIVTMYIRTNFLLPFRLCI